MISEFSPGFRLYTGSMFGGKTAKMIFDLQRAVVAGKKVQAFKVSWDNRYDEGFITANNGQLKFPAISVSNTFEIEKFLESDVEVLGIDENQFFDERLVDFVKKFRDKILIIGTSLQSNFRGEAFALRGSPYDKEVDSKKFTVGDLMALSTDIRQEWPVCTHKDKSGNICGGVAYYPQRWNEDGSLSKYSDKTIVIGAKDKYAPCCMKHFIKPVD